MKRPIESDYISQVAYTRALEAFCDEQEQIIQSYLEKDNSQQEQSVSVGEPVAQSLKDAVFTVLEGFTLDNNVRKILESAYYTTPSVPEGRQQRPPLRDIKPLTDAQYFEIDQRNQLPSHKIEQIHKELHEAAHGIKSGTDVKE